MTNVIECSDTVQCYNENEECEECGNKPVEFIHFGSLTTKENIKLCSPCFLKKIKVEKTITI